MVDILPDYLPEVIEYEDPYVFTVDGETFYAKKRWFEEDHMEAVRTWKPDEKTRRKVSAIYRAAQEIVSRYVDPQSIDKFELFELAMKAYSARPKTAKSMLSEVVAYAYLRRRGYIMRLGRGVRALAMMLWRELWSDVDRLKVISMVFSRAAGGDPELYRKLAIVYAWLRKKGADRLPIHLAAHMTMRIASTISMVPTSEMLKRAGIMPTSRSTLSKYLRSLGVHNSPLIKDTIFPKDLCDHLEKHGINVPNYIMCRPNDQGNGSST